MFNDLTIANDEKETSKKIYRHTHTHALIRQIIGVYLLLYEEKERKKALQWFRMIVYIA